ncbi:stress response NST1 [Olea europaea subsp. europaea]|uniref:Stress response NST1 n=1 Tax=Olea europaea subsp. europaea TaxID=158383 RepID=A0A8S0VHH9_OLEEU|nr:stress response NST1 [Olea europaea subsp. europaea]
MVSDSTDCALGSIAVVAPFFRFEIASPRLAHVFVLLVTLFWYEILMPRLFAWRVWWNARLKERKRLEAIEIQKLRKDALRRCWNCLTVYRDQNPRGGKFTCSYCGHISKRLVLLIWGVMRAIFGSRHKRKVIKQLIETLRNIKDKVFNRLAEPTEDCKPSSSTKESKPSTEERNTGIMDVVEFIIHTSP